MRNAILVKLWSQVSRSFVPRGATAQQSEAAQNAFLAGALGVFLHLEKAIETGDAAIVESAVKSLRRELNIGAARRGRALKRSQSGSSDASA